MTVVTTTEEALLAALQDVVAQDGGAMADQVSLACRRLEIPDVEHNRLVLRAWLLHVLSWEQAVTWLSESDEDLRERERLIEVARGLVRGLGTQATWLHALIEAREAAPEIGDDAARQVLARSFAGQVPVVERGEVARYVDWWLHPVVVARLVPEVDGADDTVVVVLLDHADGAARVAVLESDRCTLAAEVHTWLALDPWTWPREHRQVIRDTMEWAISRVLAATTTPVAVEVAPVFAGGEAAAGARRPRSHLRLAASSR